MRFRKLTIVGVGLIGGSFALAARAAGIAGRISGWDDCDVISEAVRRGIIDEPETGFDGDRTCEADLIYLAAPVRGIVQFLESAGPRLNPGTIVTDAGSTKREICRAARSLGPGAQFVGGHPMAGSHERGLAHAREDLFRGAPYAIIDDGSENVQNAAARELVVNLVRRLGARPVVLNADIHDRAVAAVSHVPQLLATALAAVVATGQVEGPTLDLAGPGFAQMTRLAASHWSTWEDICATNEDEIAMALESVIRLLVQMREDLTGGRLDAISRAFEVANHFLKLPDKSTPETAA